MARLDRLGPAKEVVQIGAVLGSEFSYELLHAVHPLNDDELQRHLRTLTDAELLYARGLTPDATYQFKHALIRDAAYEALLKSPCKELHLNVARTIDEKFPVIKETQSRSPRAPLDRGRRAQTRDCRMVEGRQGRRGAQRVQRGATEP
jgi:predicted ATPase